MPIDPKADAQLALGVLATADAYDAAGGPGKAPLDLPLEPRLAAAWALRGHIIGTDAIYRKKTAAILTGVPAWYGYVLQSRTDPGQFAALIRGTDGLIEWGEDGECIQERYPRAGAVETGFWGIYRSLILRRPDGSSAPLVSALLSMVGAGRLIVAGHSLGAAQSILLSTDLADPARLGKRVALRAFASPRPGDGLFAQYASSLIEDYRCYAREFDLVPRIPLGFGYASLPTEEIPLDAGDIRVCFGARCQHHVLFYGLQLDPTCVDLSTLPPIDAPYLDCLITPRTVLAA